MLKRLFILSASAFLYVSSAYASYCNRSSCGYFPNEAFHCHLYWDIDLGYYQLQVPRFSFGEVLGATPFVDGIHPIDEFAVKERRVGAFFPRVAWGLELPCELTPSWAGSNFRFEFAGFYFSRKFDSEPSNFVLGNFALPQLNGAGDFLAVTLGGIPTLFTGAEFEQKYRYSGVGIKLTSDYGYLCSSGFALSPFIELDYNTLHQGYIINVESIAGLAIFATNFQLDESLQTYYFDFGFGFDASYSFTPYSPSVFIFAQGGLFGSNAHTVFEGNEFASLPTPGGGATPISSHGEDTHDKFSFKTRGQLGFGYIFSPCFALAFMGQVEHWGYMPRLQNPHRLSNGLPIYDQPASIKNASATNYAALARIFIRL